MNADVVVIGIGNEFRCDDGVGPAVAAVLSARRLPGVHAVTATGEPASILDAWTDVDLCVVIDAAVAENGTPGTIRRWMPTDGREPAVVSSHGFGLPQTLALGRAVNRVPSKLAVFTVDVESIEHGVGLSPAVAAAVPTVVQAIIAEVQTRQRHTVK
jgi:hydrogenase maturation protease